MAIYGKICQNKCPHIKYKKRDSTVNQLTYIVNNIYNNLDKNEETSLVFLVQSKAFDRIFHDGLKHKLRTIGVNWAAFNLLCNYLENRQVRVVLNRQKSKNFKITASVPQGSILGPLLFPHYINDIVDNLECDVLLYADDAVLMTNVKYEDAKLAFSRVNRDLERLASWATKIFHGVQPEQNQVYDGYKYTCTTYVFPIVSQWHRTWEGAYMSTVGPLPKRPDELRRAH